MECLSRYFSDVQIDKLSSYKFLSRFSFFDVGHVEETVRFRITVYDSPWTGSSVMMTMILVRSPFTLTIFSFQESNRGAPLTFVPELHSWVNATTEYGMVVQYVYPHPPPDFGALLV